MNEFFDDIFDKFDEIGKEKIFGGLSAILTLAGFALQGLGVLCDQKKNEAEIDRLIMEKLQK